MMNDLWSYNNGVWTWRGGSMNANAFGTFPAAIGGSGQPGARQFSAVSWKVDNGVFWLFSGYGYGSTDDGMYLTYKRD